MRLMSLAMWPDEPHLDNVCEPWPGAPQVNAIGRFVLGLMHDDDHVGHIAEIVRQAQAARTDQYPLKSGGFEPCEGFRSLRSELGPNLRKVPPQDY